MHAKGICFRVCFFFTVINAAVQFVIRIDSPTGCVSKLRLFISDLLLLHKTLTSGAKQNTRLTWFILSFGVSWPPY